jgi:hypothetical protein
MYQRYAETECFKVLEKGTRCTLPTSNGNASIDRMKHKASLGCFLNAGSGFAESLSLWLASVPEEDTE